MSDGTNQPPDRSADRTSSVTDEAREAGKNMIARFTSLMGRRLSEANQQDPDFLAGAIELGLIDRAWLEDPESNSPQSAGALEVLQRLLERSSESRPNLISSLGLQAARALERGSSQAEPSVHLLCVAFTDLEGFTSFTATHGDEAASYLLGDHYKTAGPIIRSWNGRVIKKLGDGLLLTFTEPVRAIRACVELTNIAPEPLRVRAGVHYGEVTVLNGDVVGHTVNLASRICDLAKGGEVRVTQAAIQTAAESEHLLLGRIKASRLKGISGPVEHRAVRLK